MATSAMENAYAVEPCVSNGERETSSHVHKQRNGVRPGFLNNHKTIVPEDVESDQDHEEVHPEYVPSFSQATPPSMVTADCTSITLEWSAVSQTGFSPSPPEGTDLPSCSITYSLQMQQVATRPSAEEGSELAVMCKPNAWAEVYKGAGLLTQVCKLRPGRRYAFRLVCIPDIPPKLTPPASQPTSLPVAISTPEEVHPEYVPSFSQATPPSMVTADYTSITLQWSAVSQTGFTLSPPEGTDLPTCSITYSLQMQQVATRPSAEEGSELAGMCKPNAWAEVYKGAGLLTQVCKLRPGRRYAFRLVCIPDIPPKLTPPASQPTSPPVAIATPATVPGAPQAPKYGGGRVRTSLTVKWLVPDDDGGRDVYEYHLQIRSTVNGQETATQQGLVADYTGEEMRYKAARLVPGSEYKARVQAANVIGWSEWSEEESFTTEATVPEKPDPLECTADGPSAVLVTWGTPASNGGAPINSYQLQRSEGDNGDFELIYNGPDCQYRVAGLRNGFAYRFRVLAENQQGKGSWSSVATAQTAAVPPDSPSMPVVMGSNRTSVSINWQAPEADGGSPVTSYEVELRPKTKAGLASMTDEWLTVYQGEATACTMGCLYAGCVYQVRIRAQNASGWGQYSIPSDVKAAPGVPHAPASPKAVGQSAVAIELAWEAPQHDGGSDITSYRLEMSQGASTSGFKTVQTQPATQGCRADVQDLVPGTQYFFQVYAVNNQGASPASSTGSATTRPAPPLAPPPPTPSDITSSSFKLSWACPQARGAPVTEYMVNLQHLHSASLLANGHAATNGDSVLDSLDDASSTSGSTAHAQETRQGAEAASVSGTGAQTGAKRRFQGVGQWRLPWKGADPTVSVTGLHPFTKYSCSVQAGNSEGFGDWSNTASVRTAAAAPSVPISLQAQDAASADSISLHWQHPKQDNGSPVTSYQLEFASAPAGRVAPAYHKAYNGKNTNCTVSDLRPGRGYHFRVLAQNAQGQGPWSQPLQASTAADVPGPPSQPVCSKRTANGFTVKWVAPEVENGASVVSYRLQCHSDTQDFEEVYHGNSLLHKLQGLEAGTSYSLRVAAVNAVGKGCWSEEAHFATTRLPPEPPAGLECSLDADPLQRPQLMLKWQRNSSSDGLHADIASYEVELLDLTAALPSSNAAKPVKHTCSGKVQEHTIPNLLPGTRYQVKLRCVGSQGSGHGEYCNPVIIVTPGTREVASKPASVMSDSSTMSRTTSSQSLVRRGSMTGPETDVVVPANERVRKIRKGGKAGLSKAGKAKIPPERLIIYFPKFLYKYSWGWVPKRVSVGDVPEALMPLYIPCRHALAAANKVVRQYYLTVLFILAVSFAVAVIIKWSPPSNRRLHQ